MEKNIATHNQESLERMKKLLKAQNEKLTELTSADLKKEVGAIPMSILKKANEANKNA